MADRPVPNESTPFQNESVPESTGKRRIVTVIYLAAVVGCWLISLYFLKRGRPDTLVGFAFFSTLNFNCTMLGFWAGLGHWRWRWLCIPVGGLALAAFSGIAVGGNEIQGFLIYCFGIVAVVGLTAMVLRMWKGSLQKQSTSTAQVDALQFNIKDIFIWTTCIAVFLGVGRLVVQWLGPFRDWSNGGETAMIIGLAATTSLAMVVNIWAMLGTQVSIFKGITLIIATAAAMYCLAILGNNETMFSISALIAQILMVIAMLLLRRQGLRFLKKNR